MNEYYTSEEDVCNRGSQRLVDLVKGLTDEWFKQIKERKYEDAEDTVINIVRDAAELFQQTQFCESTLPR